MTIQSYAEPMISHRHIGYTFTRDVIHTFEEWGMLDETRARAFVA
jgi:hypothetical protein